MELLIFLVARREQLISRQDIVRKLWNSQLFIDTEANINNIVRKIRAALGDNPAKPHFLETVVGKGYRFIGPVRVIEALYPPADLLPVSTAARPALKATIRTDRTALAILPFVLLGNTTDDNGICLGFADALITRLGNLSGVDVLPTSTVLNLSAELTPSATAARLGVRFVVQGALQFSKGSWRLSLEMYDSHRQSSCFRRNCDLDMNRLSILENEIARQIAAALRRPLGSRAVHRRQRYSGDPAAYAEFIRGYRLSSSGDSAMLDEAAEHLMNSLSHDPAFSLAHATLSLVSATRHFEWDPTSVWLEKAEFHCRRALELNPDLPESHVANAFLLWGPSKNFQHLEALTELKRALALQNNQPLAYNRLGTILAHIGLLDHARAMYERGRQFHPRKAVSHSVVQVYVWNQEPALAHAEILAWRAENPSNKYPVYFAPQLAILTEDWEQARILLDEALELLPDEPLIISLDGVFHALIGNEKNALARIAQACAIPKSFGHAHHTYYQIASILAVLGQRATALEWLERSVSSGFACWPFFLKDPCLKNLRALPGFAALISSLQAKYPDRLGLL